MSLDIGHARNGASGSQPRSGERSRARKADLIRVALDLFAERSFAAVTIKNIGAAAGANSALIYYYFKDKEDLFCAAIESAVDQAFGHFSKLRDSHTHPAETISAWLDTHVELYEVLRMMVKVSVDYKSLGLNSPSVDASIRRFYDQEADVLQSCVQTGVARGLFRAVDPATIYTLTSTFLDGAMVRSIILPDFDLAASVAQFQRHLWEQLGYQPAEK